MAIQRRNPDPDLIGCRLGRQGGVCPKALRLRHHLIIGQPLTGPQFSRRCGDGVRIPTKSATYSDLKSVQRSDFKAVHYPGRFRPVG